MHAPASPDGLRSRLTIAFCLQEAELDQVAEQVRQREVCLLNDLPPSELDALDDGRKPVVVLSFAWSYQWMEYWTTGSRAVDAWLVVPSDVALRNLTAERHGGGGDAVAARLLRTLSDAIPRERWLDLNDPRFGKTAALRLCRRAETEVLAAQPGQSSPTHTTALSIGARERRTFALSVGATYRIAKGELGLSLLEAGWSHAEAAHVWSNGRQASMVLPVDPGDARAARCRLTGFHIGQPFRVQVLVDGDLVLRRDVAGQGSKTVDLLVPIDPPGRGADPHLRRIELCFSQTWSPSRLYPDSADRRELAVALSAISLEVAEDGLDAAMLDVVDALRGLGLGRPDPSVVGQQAGPSVFADILRSEVVDAERVAPVIVLIDLPEPNAALAGLQNVLGAEENSIYLLSHRANERQRAEAHASSSLAMESPRSACFTDTWERIVQALRFIERAPDILVVPDMNRAMEACTLLMQELALSAPVRILIVMSNDTSSVRRHKKFLSGRVETIALHDACAVLRTRRQML